MTRPKPLLAPLIAVFIGLVGFGNVSRNPRFASFHAVDILQLLASGMCLGVALSGLIASRRADASRSRV